MGRKRIPVSAFNKLGQMVITDWDLKNLEEYKPIFFTIILVEELNKCTCWHSCITLSHSTLALDIYRKMDQFLK